jgi:secreted PhoX family phosphatase
MDRRSFLKRSGQGALGVTISQVLAACAARDLDSDEPLSSSSDPLRRLRGDYGPLVVAGPELMLPKGFRYVLFGAAGVRMSDGAMTPRAHDGMA